MQAQSRCSGLHRLDCLQAALGCGWLTQSCIILMASCRQLLHAAAIHAELNLALLSADRVREDL